MRSLSLLILLATSPILTGCGKFFEKFSRINGDVTRVHFSNRDGQLHEATTLTGGLMIFFVNVNDTNKGFSFGFASEEALNSKTVLLPNGQYKVYSYAWNSSPLQGQVRCGYGDSGNVITLSGASTRVTIALTASTCGFGSSNVFGAPYGANDPTNTNFDVMTVQLCDSSAFPSCSVTTSGTWSVRAELLAGYHSSSANLAESPTHSILSDCSGAGSAGTIYTPFRIPIGGSLFSPPVRLYVYSGASCAGTASGTYTFFEGIKLYQSVSSGASYYLNVATSATSYTFSVNKYF